MQANHTVASPRKPRVIRSKEQWISLVADYQRSEQTQQAFCKERGITVSSFSKWRNQLEAQSDQQLFVDLGTMPVTDIASETSLPLPDWQVELELGKGIILRVRII